MCQMGIKELKGLQVFLYLSTLENNYAYFYVQVIKKMNS